MPNQTATENASNTQTREIKVSQYNVILLNDDYTTFDFVIMVLMKVFRKSEMEAARITLSVHQQGRGLAGTYSREIAQMKVKQVQTLADEAGYPLQAVIEEA